MATDYTNLWPWMTFWLADYVVGYKLSSGVDAKFSSGFISFVGERGRAGRPYFSVNQDMF
jgi:hypothetical protein